MTKYPEVDNMVRNPTCLLHDHIIFKSASNEKPHQTPGILNCHEMRYVPTS
jgi:hypothetical protein